MERLVTPPRRAGPHLPGVPHLHVNRPLDKMGVHLELRPILAGTSRLLVTWRGRVAETEANVWERIEALLVGELH